MDAAEDSVRLELWARPESVSAARHALSALADRLGCDGGAVRIAVSELVGNAVIHAYFDRDAGPVLILGRVMRGRLVITVADRGRGMIVRADSPGLGVGLPVVSKVARDLRIDSDDRGTAVTVSFELDGAPNPEHPTAELQADVTTELDRARRILSSADWSAAGETPLAYSSR
jgi:serine/threonine-protein kinase RsbW/stage II sporulation protein AB (anti-sigma F factor)